MEATGFIAGMQLVGNIIDAFGVLVIIIGIVIASFFWCLHLYRGCGSAQSYLLYRQSVGKAILLGLEFLVAGDIIRTVAVSPNLTNVIILAGIVVIRTFLSIALQLEIDRSWPWQPAPKTD